VLKYDGQDALDALAQQWALHDGSLREVRVSANADGFLDAHLICVPRRESPVAEVRIQLVRLKRFDLAWDEDCSLLLIAGYTAFILSDGAVYISLDPYDDRATSPDERDAFVLASREIRASFDMKAPPRREESGAA
jgi:hypothetical protein